MLETLYNRAASLARRMFPLVGLVAVQAAQVANAAAPVQQTAPRQLDIADYRAYLADDHPVRQGMRKFADEVAAASGGALQVRVRTDALPGSPAQQLAALRAGSSAAPAFMLVAGTGLAPLVPEFTLLDLPFLVQDEAQADGLLDGAFGTALLGRLAPAGLVGLAWWENGFRQITSSRGPVRGQQDLAGLHLRVIGEPVFLDTFRAFGARPVPLPFGELHAALRAGRVDAQDNFISQILAGRLYEVQSSLSLTNHSYSPLVVVANADAWRSLSAAQQQVVRAAALEAGRLQRAAARAEAQAARNELARRGLAVSTPPAAELARLRAVSAPLRERYFDQYGKALRPLYQAATGQAR
ncbi:DctP family TRAP transporter solute-binding subunit [Massilia niabensis]|uniref:DctP family TRAP transporter solute-binding subunit n=1 Tax=Massilia niabensis TaxID=544910 RepID=A0ABW0KZA9_9BURK